MAEEGSMRTLWVAAGVVLALASQAHAQSGERTGEQVVKAQCAKCHEQGLHGAPKIGDRQAWAPRMKLGLDATVRAAIKGHGAMPARGGMADLTDTELRAAILYLFNPAAAASAKLEVAPAAAPDHNRKVVGGVEIYLGLMPAGSKGVYHVNISLRDGASKALIKDAVVEARVASTLGGTTKKLNATTINESVSYSNDFSVVANERYTITVNVRRPKAAPIEAKFDFKP